MRYDWFHRDEPLDEFGQPLSRMAKEEAAIEARERRPKVGRGEKIWVVIGGITFLYAALHSDLPLSLVALSFLFYECRYLAYYLPHRVRQPVVNGIRGFSLAVFFGACIWAFL